MHLPAKRGLLPRSLSDSQRPCILSFVLFLMAGMHVSGVVSFEEGAAHLRLVPTNPTTTPPPAAPTATRVPWPASNTRCDDKIYEAIKDEKAVTHSTREPMSKKTMQVAMNNIQRALSLKVGATGGWCVEADLRLLRLLASSKKPYAKAKAIKDADHMLGIKDKPAADGDDDDDEPVDDDIPDNSGQNHPGEEAQAMDVDGASSSSSQLKLQLLFHT